MAPGIENEPALACTFLCRANVSYRIGRNIVIDGGRLARDFLIA